MNATAQTRAPRWDEAHNYTAVYEQRFEPVRNESLRLLEIGVCDPRMPGSSLKGLYEYFPNATIFGYDIEDTHRFDNDPIATFVGDQCNWGDWGSPDPPRFTAAGQASSPTHRTTRPCASAVDAVDVR